MKNPEKTVIHFEVDGDAVQAMVVGDSNDLLSMVCQVLDDNEHVCELFKRALMLVLMKQLTQDNDDSEDELSDQFEQIKAHQMFGNVIAEA